MSGLFDEPREVRALGDLYANVWQVAYVTRDLDEGMSLLRKHYGVESTEVPTEGATFLVGDEPAEWDVRISMGARGGLIVELIEPVGGEVDFYRRSLPADWASGLGSARGLHGADPGSRARRVRRHDRRAGPLPRGLPASERGHRVLQRARRGERVIVQDGAVAPAALGRVQG